MQQTVTQPAHSAQTSPRNGGWETTGGISKRMPRRVGTLAPAHVAAVDTARRQRVEAQLVEKGLITAGRRDGLTEAYPWECPVLAATEEAEILAFHDEAREAWLDDWLADLEQPQPVADELVLEYSAADYVPFQQPLAYYTDDPRHLGPLTDEPGYHESLTPFLF